MARPRELETKMKEKEKQRLVEVTQPRELEANINFIFCYKQSLVDPYLRVMWMVISKV